MVLGVWPLSFEQQQSGIWCSDVVFGRLLLHCTDQSTRMPGGPTVYGFPSYFIFWELQNIIQGFLKQCFVCVR